MKMQFKMFSTFCVLFLIFFYSNISAQDIQVIFHDTILEDTLGADIEFDFEIINVSDQEQTVFLVRTLNEMPFPEWSSSLCFGQTCFSPNVDSVATDGNPNPPVPSGDTLVASIHVNPQAYLGTAHVQVQIGTFRNPDVRTTQDFTATAIPTGVGDTKINPDEFFLAQNYPNPFNPSTNIKYGINEAGFVSLKVYDILGNEIAVLVNEYKSVGEHNVSFNIVNLSSGMYVYRLTSGKYSETKKMILEK